MQHSHSTGATQSTQATGWSEAGLPLILFVLALIPRLVCLQTFVTADEAKWVYRSAQFLLATLSGDWAETAVNLTPAVTTTWLGSIGLSSYYLLHRAEIALSFSDWLAAIPQFRIDNLAVLAATRWAMGLRPRLRATLLVSRSRYLL